MFILLLSKEVLKTISVVKVCEYHLLKQHSKAKNSKILIQKRIRDKQRLGCERKRLNHLMTSKWRTRNSFINLPIIAYYF